MGSVSGMDYFYDNLVDEEQEINSRDSRDPDDFKSALPPQRMTTCLWHEDRVSVSYIPVRFFLYLYAWHSNALF